VIFLLGAVVYKTGFFGEVVKPAVMEHYKIPYNYIRGLLSNPEHITIDIAHKNFQKIAYKRAIALEEGVLHSSSDDYVAAKIRWHSKTIPISIRLKGDLADHWSRDRKWSFRIRVKGNDTIMGMKEFSIQHPRTRGFLNDWCLHQLLSYLGNFMVLRYEFIEVTLNGDYLGIYLMEEHFEKRLIENNKFIDAPIIRIDDHLLWYNIDPLIGFNRAHLNEIYPTSPIDAFNTNTINQNKTLLMNFNKAKSLLEAFRRGRLATHQVFDIDKLAKLFAIIDLLGYRHTTAYSNIRFYYNPITSRLEPIGYDNTFVMEASSIEGQSKKIQQGYPEIANNYFDYAKQSKWHSTFFLDKEFFIKYIMTLEQISEKKFLDDFFNLTKEEYDKALSILYKNYPGYSFEQQKSILYKNQVVIKNILNPPQGLQAYFKNYDNDAITLELGNSSLLPIEVLNASCNEYTFSKLPEELIIQAKSSFEPIDFQKVQFKLPKGFSWSKEMVSNIKVHYRILGTTLIRNAAVLPWSYLDHDFLETDVIRQKPNCTDFDFIVVDESTHEIFFKQGVCNITTNLILPPDYTIICKEGTNLTINSSAKILSYSPLVFIGTDTNPIIIESGNLTGQGIIVLHSDKRSILKNVFFKQLSSPSQSGWSLSGAVTFYESPVDISGCYFIGNTSQFGLHIIRSEFTVDKSFFKRISSTALSVVFGKGTISNTSLIDCGEDGMQFLGSVITSENISIENVKNRGLNGADGSQITIKNLEIKNTKIAVECKDNSMISLDNLSIYSCDIGFAIFQSKSEFGPARIEIANMIQADVKKAYLVEEQSSLTIDASTIEGNIKNMSHSSLL
jgi:hypothetical protein